MASPLPLLRCSFEVRTHVVGHDFSHIYHLSACSITTRLWYLASSPRSWSTPKPWPALDSSLLTPPYLHNGQQLTEEKERIAAQVELMSGFMCWRTTSRMRVTARDSNGKPYSSTKWYARWLIDTLMMTKYLRKTRHTCSAARYGISLTSNQGRNAAFQLRKSKVGFPACEAMSQFRVNSILLPYVLPFTIAITGLQDEDQRKTASKLLEEAMKTLFVDTLLALCNHLLGPCESTLN